MSVYLYDEAIANRLKTVLASGDVNIITPEKAFTKSFEGQDNPQFPAVSIYRDSYTLTFETRNMTMYRRGRIEEDSELNLFATKALPIIIRYQIDVWTKTRQQNDEFVRDLIWFFTLYPEHKMTLKYSGFERTIKFNTFLEEDVVNNSQINEFEDKGQYYRSTFNIRVDEAKLFMVNPIGTANFDYEIISIDSQSQEEEG